MFKLFCVGFKLKKNMESYNIVVITCSMYVIFNYNINTLILSQERKREKHVRFFSLKKGRKTARVFLILLIINVKTILLMFLL